jgi:hypothetical protein
MPLKPHYAAENAWDNGLQYTWERVIAEDGLTLGEIGRALFPFLLHSTAIAILVEVLQPSSGTEKWNYGGKALFSIDIPITLGGTTDTVIAAKALYLRQLNLVTLPDLAGDFRLELIPPKWFVQVRLTAWQYQGDGIPDFESKLNLIGTGVEALLGQPLT